MDDLHPIPIPREALDELLFDVLRVLYKFERDKVKLFELSFEQIYLLQFLRRNSPCRTSDIAREMGIPLSTLTRLVTRLEKMQLVIRRKDDNDMRITRVLLHANGEHAVRAVEDHTFEIIRKNLRGFSPEEVKTFIRTARNIGSILGKNNAFYGGPNEGFS